MKPFVAMAAGFVALVLAFLGNRLIWLVMRGRGTAWYVPLWEESVKTAGGLLVGQVLPVHAVFGLGEAVYETARGDAAAGAAALVSHIVFGLLTILGWRWTGYPAVGLIAAAGAHIAWNRLVLRHAME